MILMMIRCRSDRNEMNRLGEVYLLEIAAIKYVGSAIGFSNRRWCEHLRLLRKGRHHCVELQDAFNLHGVTGLTFRVLESSINSEILKDREYELSKALNSINALPGKFIKQEKRDLIIECLDRQVSYREISKLHQISLGSISKIKQEYFQSALPE
jgi:Uri superfamily endonuclease